MFTYLRKINATTDANLTWLQRESVREPLREGGTINKHTHKFFALLRYRLRYRSSWGRLYLSWVSLLILYFSVSCIGLCSSVQNACEVGPILLCMRHCRCCHIDLTSGRIVLCLLKDFFFDCVG